MAPSHIFLATEGVAAALFKVPQVLHAAFVESLTGWLIGLMAIVAGAILVGLLRLLRDGRPLDCEIKDGALLLHHGRCYQHRVPLTELNLSHAAITDLSFDPGNQPRKRLAEPGCPGRNNGWFLLRNGTRALVFPGDPKNMVRIPTHLGYTLLLSLPEPSLLLERLREAMKKSPSPSAEPAVSQLEPKRHLPASTAKSSKKSKKPKKARTPLAMPQRAVAGRSQAA